MRTSDLLIIFSFLNKIQCRDSIQYFISHKKVRHMFIEELKNENNSTIRWIEFKYVFENTKKQFVHNSLKIGIYGNNFDPLNFHTCRNISDQIIPKGYDADIIRSLQETLNISTDFIFVNDLNTLIKNKIDLVICRPHSNTLPPGVIELYPIIKTNLILVFKGNKLHFSKDIFILTFAGSLWIVFFTIMIFLAICLRVSTKRYAVMKSNHEAWTWVEITLWAIAAACQQGLSHTPSGFASCFIFFLGYLMAYLLYTGFTAAITSILVEKVGTDDDLNNIRLETLHLVSLECTRDHVKELQGKFLVTEYVEDLEELFKRINSDSKIGIGPGIFIQQYMANKFDFDELTEFQIMNLEIRYSKGFLALRNNPWTKMINKHIVALDESGILQNTLRRNLRPVSFFDLNSKYSSASQEHVGSAIVLFLGGVVISLLFFVAEVILYFYKRGHDHTRRKN